MVFDALDPYAPLAMTSLAASLRTSLRQAGPPPWSIAEARIDDDDFAKLKEWAFREGGRAIEQPRVGGLLLVALIAEFNRREGLGNQIWFGISELFNDADRPTLFNASRGATNQLRHVIEHVVKLEELRHAFYQTGRRDEHRWYNTVQLQYGFSRCQCEQIPEWIATRQFPLACRRLLDPDSPYRSKSFQRLVDTLYRVWTDQLPTAVAKEDLRGNYWILPDWIDELLHALTSWLPYDGDTESDPPKLDVRETLEWDAVLGPLIAFRLGESVPLRCDSDRCTLTCNGRILGEWLRTGGGDAFRLVGGTGAIPLDTATIHYVLEGDSGLIHEEFHELPLVESDQRVLVVGRRLTSTNAVPQDAADRPIVIVTDRAERVEPPAGAWALVRSESATTSPIYTKWWYFDPPHQRIEVVNENNERVWSSKDLPSPPTHKLAVQLHNSSTAYSLEDDCSLRLSATPPATVTNVVVDGKPAMTSDTTGADTTIVRLRCNLGHTVRGAEVAATVQLAGRAYWRRQRVHVPVVGIASCLNAELWSHPPNEGLRYSHNARSCFRLIAPVTMPWLHEGAKAVRLHANDRLLPRGLAGRGAQLAVSSERYTGGITIPVARAIEDHGDVCRLTINSSTQTAGISFWRAKALRSGHTIVLWMPQLGMAHVPSHCISARGGNMRWEFSLPDTWYDHMATSSVAVAIAYDGECRGWDIVGPRQDSIQDFCTRNTTLNAFLDPLSHFAALRWFQLPVLLSAGEGHAISTLATTAPHKMIAAWLSADVGLGSCRQACGLPLAFSSNTTADLDVLRETLWKMRLSEECAEAFATDVQDSMITFWSDERGLHRALQEVPICVTAGLRSWAKVVPKQTREIRAVCGAMYRRLVGPTDTPDGARKRLAIEAAKQLGLEVDALESVSIQPAIRYWEFGTFAPDRAGSQAIERLCGRVHHSSKYRQCLMFDLCRRLESELG